MVGKNPKNDGGLSRLSRAQRDIDDLQNELAGRETGRPTRFFNENSGGDTRKGRERQRLEREKFISALRRLMDDPIYAERYDAFDQQLRKAEEATVSVLMILTERQVRARADLERIRESATTLEDGTRVYRTRDGSRAYTERGRLLTEEEMQSVPWPDMSPSWEEHEEQRLKLERIEQERNEVLRYQQDVLDPARERMSDEDNPPSLEEIDAMKKSVEEGQPPAITAYLEQGPDFELEKTGQVGRSEDKADPSSEARLDLPALPPSTL